MARVANITFACENPLALAQFWCGVLGYELDRVEGELAEALLAAGMAQDDLESECAAFDPADGGPRLYFQRKQKTPTSTIPIHVDVQIAADEDPDTALARFRELGATFVETKSRSVGRFSETWTIMRDPEGNPFCVQQARG
jgi:catechol 2,3-dioxygenase-like lactoylglutathione lyase family enzyme